MDEYDWADQERLVRQDVEEIERNMNELTLVVKQNPGSIEINFDELEQRLDEKLAEYDGIIFTAETKDIGKKEATSLRNLKKDIDATRKAVKKKWMEPYDEFDTRMKALSTKVDKPISAIDEQLKAFEEKKIEILKVDEITGLIWIKVPLKYGGYRKMFNYEKDLDEARVNERIYS